MADTTPSTADADEVDSPETEPSPVRVYDGEFTTLDHADVRECYPEWETPQAIISDGAYGIGSFEGEPKTVDGLTEWYRPHVEAWSEAATAETSLWFWNTEHGWATVHPLLEEHGWTYRGCNIWDKGIQHIAGNSNTQTMRKFPQVTEVCVHYVKDAEFTVERETLTAQEWLRNEWQRTGLTFDAANEACGVADAASRKHLSTDHQWYPPSSEMFTRLADYANEHGDPEGRPYFSRDGETVLSGEEWSRLRPMFDLDAGVTNVWNEAQLRGEERMDDANGETLHLNQKPKRLIRRILQTATAPGDRLWEPFGGLCTVGVVAHEEGRYCHSAEKADQYARVASRRLERAVHRKTDGDEQASLGDF